MNLLKKCLIGLLLLTITGSYFPKLSFCAAKGTAVQEITRHTPKMMSTPEADIEWMPKSKGGQRIPTWLKVGLGVVIIGGLVVAVSGGDDNTTTTPPPEESGKVSVEW